MVSDLGRVKSFAKGGERILVPVIRSGYPSITLWKSGRYEHWTIHRLVMFEFDGPAPEGLPEIDHLNGNKKDSRRVNLQYVSSSENKKRAYALGLADRKGEKHHLAKLKAENVLDIFYSTLSAIELADKYVITQGTVNDIKRGTRWSHLTGKKHEKTGVRRLTDEEVVSIFNDRGTYRALGEKYKVAFSVVQGIKNKKSHRIITKDMKIK